MNSLGTLLVVVEMVIGLILTLVEFLYGIPNRRVETRLDQRLRRGKDFVCCVPNSPIMWALGVY